MAVWRDGHLAPCQRRLTLLYLGALRTGGTPLGQESGSAATRSCPRRPANSAAASSTLSTSRVIGRAPSCVTRLANWLRLVITTRQAELPGSRGRTWFAVAGVVQHHQHLSVGQQAAIQRCLGIQVDRDPLRRDPEGVQESAGWTCMPGNDGGTLGERPLALRQGLRFSGAAGGHNRHPGGRANVVAHAAGAGCRLQHGSGTLCDPGAALPAARGPLTEELFRQLVGPLAPLPAMPDSAGDALWDDDFHLALYACYELHYRGFRGVEPGWEWEPSLLGFRRTLEARFEAGLIGAVAVPPPVAPHQIPEALAQLVAPDQGPSLSRYLARRATLEQFREFVIHRSAYHLKEADPHTWATPRLTGRAKAALVEIQADEYGGGRADRMHSALFARTMQALGLDASYGAYLGAIGGTTLATVNLMSLFGLHRRWRGAAVGHLAAFEMTSSVPNGRYSAGLGRLGFGAAARAFYDEHVQADSVHELIASHDLAGGLACDEPGLAPDIVFGAAACLALDAAMASDLLGSWARGASSLRM